MHLLDRTNLLSDFPELGTPYRKHRFGSTAFTSNFTCRAVAEAKAETSNIKHRRVCGPNSSLIIFCPLVTSACLPCRNLTKAGHAVAKIAKAASHKENLG